MRRTLLSLPFLVAAIALALAARALGYPDFARQTKLACATCHANPAGGVVLTEAAKAYLADKTKVPSKPIAGPQYAGSNKCRMCHLPQYKSWEATKHAKALDMLKATPDTVVAAIAAKLGVEVKAAAAEDDACVSCHVTGFRLPGGYPAADSAKNVALQNVTCEACHGPGGKHVVAPLADKKKLINRGVTAKMCMQCHTPAMSPKFNFEEYKKRGVHLLKAGG
jgi:hypothetical protein